MGSLLQSQLRPILHSINDQQRPRKFLTAATFLCILEPVGRDRSHASVEHHGVQPTGYMDNELVPYRGARVKALSRRPTNCGSNLPRTAHLDVGMIGCHQCMTPTREVLRRLPACDQSPAFSRIHTIHHLYPCPNPPYHGHYQLHTCTNCD